MSHRIALCAALFLLMGVAATQAQEAQPTAPSSSASQASPTSSSQSADQQASAPSAANSSAQPAMKKVWTNDDVTGLRSTSAISTVGASGAKSAKSGAGTAAAGNANWYANQITGLQAKLPPIDAKIAELQDALAGKPTGDGKTSSRPSGIKIDSWSDELMRLQQKRDAVQQQIDALREQARRHGVPNSALPL